MPPRRSARNAKEAAADPADTAAPAPDTKKDDAAAASRKMHPLVYVVRQYSGFFLGALSIFLTWYTHDPESPYMMWWLWGCLLLGLLAAVIHEFRPYKRMGYGDVAWEQLFESRFWKSITGRTDETRDFLGPQVRRRRA